jgi:chromosome partitioning protein
MVIVCANSKGGVGKSTIAVHVAVGLYDRGLKTALLDADKQRSSSQWIVEAEPQVTVRVADTAESCVLNVQELARSNDFLICDAPGGLEDLSRTLLLLADLAIFPISPSILDVRSVAGATEVHRYAQAINGGRPEGILVLNKMKTRDTLSRELRIDAPKLGLRVATCVVRELQAFRDAAQQGTVVGRFGRKALQAAADIDGLISEILGDTIAVKLSTTRRKVGNG